MPIVVKPTDVRTIEGDGWTQVILADRENIGVPAMTAQRWVLAPNAQGPQLTHNGADQLLYVIRGGGSAQVDEKTFLLDEESVLWLEAGETYQFVAADQGLEILQGYAPGE
ncbi:MAG: hypothetical protein AAF485_25300 [Chloroflexota bacterium]